MGPAASFVSPHLGPVGVVSPSLAPVASNIPYHLLGGPGDQLSQEECTAFGVPPGSKWCSGPGFAPTYYDRAHFTSQYDTPARSGPQYMASQYAGSPAQATAGAAGAYSYGAPADADY